MANIQNDTNKEIALLLDYFLLGMIDAEDAKLALRTYKSKLDGLDSLHRAVLKLIRQIEPAAVYSRASEITYLRECLVGNLSYSEYTASLKRGKDEEVSQRLRFARAIELFLNKQISATSLAGWAAQWTDKIDSTESLLYAAWWSMRQVIEDEANYRTTRTELEYIVKCLKGELDFSEKDFRKVGLSGNEESDNDS